MSDDSIQIEFTDDELEGNVVDNDPASFVGNEGAGNDTQTISQKTGSGTETLPEGNETQGQDGGDTEGAPAGGDTDPENQDGFLAQTDADLATAHGVTEDEIRYAKSMGWSPKDKFRGDPKDWKDPKAFIDIAEQSAPVMRERLREMSKKVTEMQKAFPTILEMQKRELQNKVDTLTATNEALQKELEDAHLMADSRKAADIVEKLTENKIKKAIVEEQIKHVGEKDGLAQLAGQQQETIPEGIDIEKERAWRDAILPKLTLEQREIYDQAARFVALPQNADKTTNERIAYIEGKIFGRRSTPAVAAVARPTTTDVTSSVPAARNEYEGWDSLSAEEKKIATSIIEDTEWYQKKDTDPKAKAQWNEFKKQFAKQGA